MSVSIARRLFTTQEFRRMVEAGVFEEDERLELVDGEIVVMPTIDYRHATCVRKLNYFLRNAGDRALLDVQNPLGISEDNDFYPDVVLLKPRADVYANGIPSASDTILVIEVSHTTLEFDRFIKKATLRVVGSTGALDRRPGWVPCLGPPEAPRGRLRRSIRSASRRRSEGPGNARRRDPGLRASFLATSRGRAVSAPRISRR